LEDDGIQGSCGSCHRLDSFYNPRRFFGGEVPFVTPTELKGGIPVTKTPVTLTELGANQVRVIPENSVMVCCIGSLGKIGIAGTRLATNQQINSLVFDEKIVCPRYGFHYCQTLKPLLTHLAPSTTVAIINKGRFQEIQIPLPPLPEQKRIAAILDKADSIRRKRQEAVRLTEELLRSVFLDMFGDPVTNPKGWKVVKLGEIAIKVTDGEHQTPKRTSEGIKLLSARNIQNGFIDVSDVDFVGIEEHERIKQRCNPIRGDILISCSGTIGRVTTVEIDEPFSLVRSVAMVKPKTNLIDSKYLEHYLRTTALHRIMQNNANTSSQANLFQNQIRDLPICLPPRGIQEKFTVNISAIEKIVVLHNKALTDHDALFRSLLQSAFKSLL